MNYTDQTIQAYEEAFEKYVQKTTEKKPKLVLLNKFQSLLLGKKVLEIGFGTGVDAEWFAGNGFDYTGFEPVNKFCQMVAKKVPGVKIIQMDIRKADFPAESFDGIWAMSSLLHFNDSDVAEILQKCHHWLKPDGVIFVTLKEGHGTLTRPDGRFFNLFSKNSFLKLAGKKFSLVDFSKEGAENFNTGKENWLNFYLKKL